MELETAFAGSGQRKRKLLDRAKLSLLSHRASQQTNHKQKFKYVRGDLIGKGSYGRVYMGLNANTGEIMAVKQVELTPSAIDRSAFRKQREIIDSFKLENDMLKDLDHTHIVRYLGFEESDEHLSIFLEYVPGGTITSCLRKYGRFRDDVTRSFTFQILSGLKYLHSKGIIHRDLKSDNILLDPAGVCKISDFGISKKVDDLQNIRAFTNMKGTIQWMAPEILDTKKAGYDAKVDIWSVGCVVLEMWSGEKPWSNEVLVSVMYKVSQYKQPPPIPPGIKLSDLAEEFRLQCFQANPQDRPTATELQAHPYLRLPFNWTFPYVIHGGSINRKSKSQFSFSSLSQIDQGAPYAPTLRPLTESTFDTQVAEKLESPNATAGHDRTIVATKATQPSLQDNGPRIVVITPPGSPRDRSYAYDEFELSTKLSVSPDRSPKRSRRKILIVSNPDSDGDSDKPSNHASQGNYAPPPLPEISSLSLSSRLAPSRPSFPMHRRCLTEDGSWRPNNQPTNPSPSPSLLSVSPPASGHSSSTANSGLSLFGRHNRPRVDTSIDKGVSDYTDTSDTDDDLHLWNKPPADLQSRRKLTSASSPTLSRGEEDASPKSRRSSRVPRASRRSWLTRPGLDDVYDHLQRFFPDHEVGQTFTQPRANVSTPANGVENKELVHPDAQTTASVQVQRSKRQLPGKPQSSLGQLCRMTRFWSATEER
ncbi:kinase-like domain-containing protein [Amanita rubescens]|nr:kinase-like domain-containing protein [Amanita rubescens]